MGPPDRGKHRRRDPKHDISHIASYSFLVILLVFIYRRVNMVTNIGFCASQTAANEFLIGSYKSIVNRVSRNVIFASEERHSEMIELLSLSPGIYHNLGLIF